MKTSLALFILTCLAACTTSPGEDATDSEIIGGSPTSAYPAVMALFAGDLSTGAGALCTASLIAPRVLLTAAHCVAASEVGKSAQFVALTGADIDAAATSTLATSSVMHDEAFDPEHPEAGYDVGAVILKETLATKPLPVNRTSDPSALVGHSIRLVGYGVDDGSAQTGAGIKRTTTTTLRSVTDRLLSLGDGKHDTCQGDSGGPALATIDGKETIIGVTYFGQAGCGDGGYDTRIDRYASFIDAALAKGK